MSSLDYGFPSAATPVTGPDGTWTPAWYRLVNVMWQRLGGTVGIDTKALNQTVTLLNDTVALKSDMFLADGVAFRQLPVPPVVVPDAGLAALLFAGGRS